jgi:hypothetical protein
VTSATVAGCERVGSLVGVGEDNVRCLVGFLWVAGGLVGYNGGTVSNCRATGNVTGDGGVGGLVGYNGGTVSNSSSNANVSGDDFAGGLVGWNYGTVSNSCFKGSVTGGATVGGLVGYNEGGPVSNSYSSGSVTGGSLTGGLIGFNEGTVSNSFWDTQSSGQGASDGGTGETTAEMQDIATFSGAGWNITAVAPGVTNPAYIWNIVDGQTYPFLSWQSTA